MKIKKAELQKILEKVKPATTNKEVIEQSAHFALLDNKIVAYNDEISISASFETQVTGAINATLLYDFVAKAKTEEITIDVADNKDTGKQLILTSGRSKAGITLLEDIKLPLKELGQIGRWRDLPEDFADALKLVKFCAGTDMSKPLLTCIHVRNDGIMEACDNYRLLQYRMKSGFKGHGFLLPARVVDTLLKHDLTKFTFSDGWVHFGNADDSLLFSSRSFSEAYPDLSAFFEYDQNAIDFEFPDKLIEITERADAFMSSATFMDRTLQITAAGRKLSVRVENRVDGWFEEFTTLPQPISSEFTILIHPNFLSEILKVTTKCKVISNKKLLFTSDTWAHVVALKIVE